MLEFGERKDGVTCVERLCAYAIARDASGAIALTRTRKGYFLPGGGVEPGEGLEAALRREVLEELGYAATIVKKLSCAAEFVVDNDERTQYRKVGHFFEAILTEKVAEPTERDHELVWCGAGDSVKRLAQEFQAWAVRQALGIG
ncbi:MAG TPA: NUDIX domain-containing protein [Candidatus Acidoferrum sp.]|nr:NUDIX domain-containing protein [Candidatus Acidoferrum sp.]